MCGYQLVDFGFAKEVSDLDTGGTTNLGTIMYYRHSHTVVPFLVLTPSTTSPVFGSFEAPEIIKNCTYGASVDVWALGVILFMMLAGDIPWAGGTEAQLYVPTFRSFGCNCVPPTLLMHT